MSLFKQLERLYRPERFQREDFLTEIVAQILRDSPVLTLDWLRSLSVTDLKKADHVHVATQVSFEKLPGHDTDSRPDIVVRLVGDGSQELIFIESKVGAIQGDTQLQRYAGHLADEKERKGFQKISLVFITLNYEAAINPRPQDSCFRFQQTRWFIFYRELKAYLEKNSDGLTKQLKLFMEENRMSLGNQFRSTDLVAIENFHSALALMAETLEGEVGSQVLKILGRGRPGTIKEFRERKRYALDADFNKRFGCLIGYWFPNENPDDPIWVGIEIYSYPKTPVEKELVRAFRDWINKTSGTWTGVRLDCEWACIRKGKTIRSLIGSEDDVRAIKDHLLQLLGEVEQFKKTYPDLPWK